MPGFRASYLRHQRRIGGGLGALAFASQQQSLEQRPLTACDPAAPPESVAVPQLTPILDNFFSKDLLLHDRRRRPVPEYAATHRALAHRLVRPVAVIPQGAR